MISKATMKIFGLNMSLAICELLFIIVGLGDCISKNTAGK